MGDRTTPMKFGPEWLRNLSREPTGSGAQSATPAVRPVTSSATATSNTSASTKVQLAKLRYGREEMLVLYDPQAAEAPVQLKSIELLYNSRGKSPYALSSNFEEDTREAGGTRSNPPIGAMSADRFGPGRGRGFNLSSLTSRNTVMEGRGRARLFPRPTSSGSDTFRAPNWHNGAQRSYPWAPDDDPNSSRGLWNNGNGPNPPGIRPTAEQADWANKMAYRKPRQNHTNWRQQQNRDEGEEWRSDGARRGQDKWDREWPERGPQEKGWSTNRRHWGGDADELPEWAVENSEACGGTFDASGAFHGYSNDDSNIPKTQDSSYALARSQTHGSLTHDFKQFAKRRFDAIEVKFKKPTDESGIEESGNPSSASNEGDNANSGQTREIPKIENIRNKLVSHEEPEKETPEMQDEAAALPAAREDANDDYIKARTATAKRNEMLRQTEKRESSSEQGTYKSAMMATSNNRSKIDAPSNTKKLPHRFHQILDAGNKMESDYQEQRQIETKLVEDMLDMHMSEEFQAQLLNSTTQSAGIPNSFANQMPSSGMQMRMNNQLMTPGMGINQQQSSNSQTQTTPETNMIQSIGISNSVLNASLGLPVGTGSNMSIPPPPIPNPGVLSTNLQGLGTGNMQNMQIGGIQGGMQVPGMPATSFQNVMPGNNMQGLQPNMQTSNMNNNNMQSASGMPGYQAHSLFMGAPNNMQNPGEMRNQGQQNMYPMHGHGLQQSASQGSFTPASMYGNMMQPPPAVPHPNIPLADLWYYEDPNKTIQGPFTSKEMYGWYHAGFFTPDLMVRRACESGLMPLASYGLMPFGPTDIMPPQQFNLSRAIFDMRQHENLMNAQQAGLGPEVESLWGMREPSAEELWYRPPVPLPPPEQVKTILNNLSMFFWDQPETLKPMPQAIKDMKTEAEILCQMRASQSDPAAQNLTFICDAAVSPEEAFTAGTNIAPNLEELQKLIGSDIQRNHTPPAPELPAATTPIVSSDTHDAVDQKPSEKADPVPEVSVKQQQTTKAAEAKPSKQPAKVEEKPKIKEALPKTKAKKIKEENKEESTENKKEEKKTIEKRLDEPSPPKNKREDKSIKKDLEKEKKEWLKDGFTIVKGAEKKDSKKKDKEEARAAEEAEKKRKEDEKRALEAEKNKPPEPVTRRQQLEQGQRQSQSLEQPPKKAPWSAQPAQTSRVGLALSDIQRLEREKKLEQMKEQQQMMQVIAQQQAVAAQREQHETQAGQLGWAKKKQANSPPGQTLAEIQAEARKQAAAMVAAAAAAAAREEKQPTPPPVNVTPWGSTNGAGFWDCPSSLAASGVECSAGTFSFIGSSSTSELKSKKKVTVVAPLKKEPSPPKKEVSPSADFDTWCIHVLSNWKDAANIDIPTFVAFLRDIESPYEVKDYVKCYLGDTKEANDFARQFLERRSRMLRVGMVTPSDDLCSPAAALTPRTNSGSDYTEVKSKGNKKTKKNKMLKVDARILGFSVTASEDRINVGDIDTA